MDIIEHVSVPVEVSPVTGFRSAVDALRGLDLTVLSGPELLDLLRELEIQKNRLAAADHALLAEIHSRHVAGDVGCRDIAALLVELLRVDPAEARRRVNDMSDFAPRLMPTGAVVEPTVPAAAVALAEGAISIAHARHIASFTDHLPPHITPEVTASLQERLVEDARHTHPRRVGQFAEALLARIDQDGTEPREQERARHRAFTIATNPDGWSRVSGYISPLLTAHLNVLFDALAAPQPEPDGTPDDRSPAARRHDALLDACQRVTRSGTLPDFGGTPATLLVTISETSLRERVGHGTTSHGDLLPIADILQLAAEAEIIPVVLNDAGGIISYGRGKRFASVGQRRALATRDKGCTSPGCTAPPGWCEVHHLETWKSGGKTDLNTMGLVCKHDHRKLNSGYRMVMIDGVPNWIFPSWIDPTQTPRRNTAHHTEPDFKPPDPGG